MDKTEKEVKLFLLRVGIKGDHVGYTYLEKIILNCIKDPTLFKNLKEVYFRIAEEYHEKNPLRVEANMSNAINFAFKNKKLEGLNKLFGVKMVDNSHKPTCAELIRLGTEYINMGLYKNFVWEEA